MFNENPSSSVGSLQETVLDEILVSARLAIGLERLRLLFTSDRLIVAHIGKRGGGALALGSFMGFLANGLEDLIKGGRENVKKKSMGKASPEEILQSDEDNFIINYSKIVNVQVTIRDGRTSIILLTGTDKLEFYTGASIDRLRTVLGKVVPDKLTVTSQRTT